MNIENFSRQAKKWQLKLAGRLKQTNQSPPSFELLAAVIEEYRTALEDLTVAAEELHQQNQELLSERWAAETEHQRYQELLEFIPDGCLLTDTAGTIREANRAAAKLLNVSQPYLLGKPLAIFITPQEHLAFYDKLKRLQQDETTANWEIYLQPRESEPIAVAITIAPVLDRHGQILALRWLLRNINILKQAEVDSTQLLVREQVVKEEAAKEAARSAAEERINNILKSITDAFISLDTDWRYTYVNAQAEQILGKRAPDLIGKNIWQVFPSTITSQSYKLFHQAVAEQITITYEEFFPIFDKWFVIRLNPSSEGLSVYFLDITEQKRSEAALRQSEARFRRLVESNIIGSIVADFSGNITEANDAFLDLVGYSKEELMAGKISWQEMTPKKYYSLDRQAIAEVKQSGVCTPYEKEFICKNGTRVPILLGLALLEGTTDACICFVLDLTHIKHLERELRQQTQELAKANRMKDEFLAVLSHELRSPLTAILGWSQLLQNGSPTAATTAHAVEIIVHNAKLQAQLIDDLLDVSSIITGKLILNAQPIELAPVIQAAIDSVLPAATAKQIQLQQRFESTFNIVFGDSERLQQVMWNLLVNAIKFTPQGGSVKVEAVSIKSDIEIRIIDSGIGISPEFLPFVFERFRQADSTNTRAYSGMGLGLAIVRHLVEMHGGTVHVASPGQGQGATFTVKLPVWQQDAEDTETQRLRAEKAEEAEGTGRI